MNGRRLAAVRFPATAAGYAGLLAWMAGLGGRMALRGVRLPCGFDPTRIRQYPKAFSI
jgi:hypothetical protein